MNTLEMLVKLASFGTAGVCILAVFIVGKYILALPKDSPSWKVSLMKRYQIMCIIIAIISLIAGGLNAYFNQGKIESANKSADEANQNAAILKTQYLDELKKSEAFRNELNFSLERLHRQINNNPGISNETKAIINDLKIQTHEYKMKSLDEVIQKKVRPR
jgi:hypothetical protein